MLALAGLVLVAGLVIGIIKMMKAEQVHDHSQDVSNDTEKGGAYRQAANVSLADTMNESKMNDS